MTFPGVEGLRIPATLEAARSARHRVRGACEGLSEEQTAVAVLLTSELVSNAVRHPLRDESDTRGAIVLSIYRTAELLRVEVGDHDSRPLPRVRRPNTPLESGMGLYLVATLATAWGSIPRDDGKAVWFELAASPINRR
jgi:anti-sigma regulatory factor (Ser/Thr protein kinase)